MYYQKINLHDFSNGEGHRLSLFVSGCVHDCPGCFNTSAMRPNSGYLFTHDTLNIIIDALEDHDGLSILGGDPWHPRNRSCILHLCRTVRKLYPEKDIWLWTGYDFSELSEELLNELEVVIDGKYERDKPTTLAWRGSANQRLYRNNRVLGEWTQSDADNCEHKNIRCVVQ